jgi:tetratricopeptide (TPR) repeat protein
MESRSVWQGDRGFQQAIDVNPNPPAYVNRGTAYSRLGQDGKALADFNKAVELDQNYASVYVNRGSLYLKTGNKEGAASDYRKACSLGNREGCEALRALQKWVEPISKLKYRSFVLRCHSGLPGIFLCFRKDSRRALLAGMTALKWKPILR